MKLLTPQIVYTLIFCFGIGIIFLTLSLKIKKGSQSSAEALEDFLLTDHEANFITKKTPPSDLLLPLEPQRIPITTDPCCVAAFELVHKISLKPMARLSHLSNLELKRNFGINHLEKVFDYEMQYFHFLKALTDYGICLYNNNYFKESLEVLEYSIQLGCDLNKCYLYLIKNYGIIRDIEKLISLKKYLKDQPPLGKEMIEAQLEEMLQSLKNQ